MLAVLLLGALLVLGLIGLVVYLLFFRSDPPPEAGDARPGTSAPATPDSTPADGDEPGPGGDQTGSGSTAVPGGGDTDDLEKTARDYVDAVNGRDESAAKALTCERTDAGTLYSVTEGRQVRLASVEVLEGAVGTANLTVGQGETALLLEKREDRWCVAI
jgi:hypothetical protein